MKGYKLLLVILFNLIISVAEIIGGILSGSLALLADSFHNLTDTFSLALSYFAIRIGKKSPNPEKTFGYKRAEIIAAFLNSAVMMVIAAFLVFEGIKRISNPHEIEGGIMMTVAIIGLLGNFASILFLKKDMKHSLNVRAAFLHLLSDTVSSVAVVLGGLFIILYNFYLLDPLITFLLAVFIFRESFLIFKETLDILMQGTPPGIKIKTIKRKLEEESNVRNIHHIHIWRLSDSDLNFEAHVKLGEDCNASRIDKLRKKLEKILEKEFHIGHTTLQFELGECSKRINRKD